VLKFLNLFSLIKQVFSMRFLPRHYLIIASSLIFNLSPLSSSANTFAQAIKIKNRTHSAAALSQKKINTLDDRTRKMLEQYRSTTRQTKTLLTYNAHLETLLASQEQEKQSLTQQLEQIEITQQEIVPLIINMQKSLERFVALDLPFLPKERQKRLQKLKAMMSRADVTTAEKFRRLIEAYQIENSYGNTIEAYRGNIQLGNQESSVDFLRLGRIALYYQRLDGSESGFWNQQQNRWEKLDSSHTIAIRKGLRIARKETAPDLLSLPISAATVAN
jgi:hypothetical protein